MDFRTEVRTWLADHLTDAPHPRAWERELGKAGWIGLGWPGADGETYGNRRATLDEQVVWAEEYARSGAPARMGTSGRTSSPRPSSRTAPRSRSAATCPPWPGARRCGARGTANREPGPTSPGCGPPPCRTGPAGTP